MKSKMMSALIIDVRESRGGGMCFYCRTKGEIKRGGGGGTQSGNKKHCKGNRETGLTCVVPLRICKPLNTPFGIWLCCTPESK